MNFHNITKDDMNNGSGLRVVLWLSGCSHHCDGCHNKITWDCNNGIPFDIQAKNEIFDELDKDYISGITFSGGDPLHESNLEDMLKLISEIKSKYPTKTIWLYTGYIWEQIHQFIKGISKECFIFNQTNILRQEIVSLCDVIVDGKFINNLADINYRWAGSTNQRVIDVQKSLKLNKVIFWDIL